MITLGLTGSIGMGKSTTAGLFREAGVPVHDADAAVGELYAQGGPAVEPVGRLFPGAVRDGAVDRERLTALLIERQGAFRALEAVVHPLVAANRDRFLLAAHRARAPVVVLDVPLLFETGGDREVDGVVVVSAPEDIQRQRVLARPGMTEEKLAIILSRQGSNAEKCARADFIIETGGGMESARRQVKAVLDQVKTAGWRGRRAAKA